STPLGRCAARELGHAAHPLRGLWEPARTRTRATNLCLCIAERGLSLWRLHLAWRVFFPPLWVRRDRYWARTSRVWRSWVSAWPAHWTRRRPLGEKMAGARRPRHRCTRGRRLDV